MKKAMRIALWLIASFGSLSVLWILFYLLMLKMSKMLHFSWNLMVLHLISAVLGLLIFGLTLSLLFSFLKPRRMNYFQAIIQAIRQIAKGNYNIDLELPVDIAHHPEDPFRLLTENIHYMAKELGEIERVRQEFISNVSHEIQSPLTSIKGFAHVLEDPTLDQKQRLHYLQIIRNETTRLSNLSDNLLKLTSLENEKHPIIREPYRIDRQIRRVILLLEPKWKEKNLQLEIDLNPVLFAADADLMNQVWSNLIDNSIKFTPIRGTVAIKLFEKKEAVVFSIRDSGIGIKEEALIHLFERFYKADRSRNHKLGGNGLGLSIVKKILDVHGGKVHVTSTYGMGTQFTVQLPK
ncbi:sensor histidine kinase [Sporolactobacillus spathodeae]|uniref:histidine kinase n=1 Tax=Sporolactobacillus spathodeae TaxID=1465502 RepID=A0ABS2Q802_9BACL|nr:HAMP domain-containing sensor histidine kinase [Sporolactobacillus spathodeae]MBM7657883.1 signal transduction histidine kinase [Sporolactobacillus spathodeae]